MAGELKQFQKQHDDGAVVAWADCHALQMRLQEGFVLVEVQVDHLRRAHHEHHLLARKGMTEQMAALMGKYNELAAAYAASQRGGKRKVLGGDDKLGSDEPAEEEEVRERSSRLKTPWTKILRRAKRSKSAVKKMKPEDALKIVYDCYGKKLAADKVDDRNGKERTPLANFMYDYLVRRFGFQNIADQNLLAIVEAIKRAAKKPDAKVAGEQAVDPDRVRTAGERLLMFGRLCGVVSADTYTPRTGDIFLRSLQLSTKDSDVAVFLRSRKVGSAESRLPLDQCIAATQDVFPLGVCSTKLNSTKLDVVASAMKQASAATRLQASIRGFALRRRVSIVAEAAVADLSEKVDSTPSSIISTPSSSNRKIEVPAPTHNYCGMWRQQLRMTASR
jgi:hypothetical protein